MDTSRYVCVSCERLCYKKSVSEISKVKVIRYSNLERFNGAYKKSEY